MLDNLTHKTGIGDYSYGTHNWNHTVVGVPQTLRGGKFIAGFLSAGVIKGIDLGNSGVSLGRTVAAAALGGATSVLGGGKFGNGAATAAFARLFNGEVHPSAREEQCACTGRARVLQGNSNHFGSN